MKILETKLTEYINTSQESCTFLTSFISLSSSFQVVHITWEEQRDQHTGHSGGTLWEVHGPGGGVHERAAILQRQLLH